jgi:transposase
MDSHKEAEIMSIQAETWAEIRRLKLVESLSTSEISRILKIDRKTVRKALQLEEAPQRKPVSRISKLDPFTDYINERLEKYPNLPASVVYEEIKRQGYAGRMRILYEYMSSVKGKNREVYD